MGVFDIFGDSLEETVTEALEKVRQLHPEIRDLSASISGKVVTLTGTARDMAAKTKAMRAFSQLVGDANVINTIALERHETPEAPMAVEGTPEEIPAPAEESIYEVQLGDTLGHIAHRFYGKAGAYMKIFEANRDILDNPDLIKVGQKLRIPE